MRALLAIIRLSFVSLSIAVAFQGTPAVAQEVPIRVSPLLEDLSYGIYCRQDPERRDPAPNTASGMINIVPSISEFQFRQKLVPAEIGIGFGVLASAPDGVLFDPVTVTVTHPPYADSGFEVEQWDTDIDAGSNLMGFSFDHAYELELGEWTFTGTTQDGEELFHISFEVVAPELMPHVLTACFDAFMS